MADSQNRRLMELFYAALDMTREQQDKLLLRIKLDSPKLGARLAKLIEGDRASLDARLRVANIAGWSRNHRESTKQTGAPSPTLVRPGMMVDRYQLIRELGCGGMGYVYLARDTRLGRLAAIKFLHLSHSDLIQRFIAEARATALCSHENIVIIYEVDEFQGIPYMALEYLQGQTLRQFMQAQTPGSTETGALRSASLSAERAVDIAIPILRALKRAHAMGIIHRDLKPENIMLCDAGTVKVLDFGIAKLLDGCTLTSPPNLAWIADSDDESESMEIGADLMRALALGQTDVNLPVTHTGALVGTLPYMSPEQLRGQPLDARTDVWSMGVMLFEMLTGRHPLAPISRSRLHDVSDMSKVMPSLGRLRPDLGALARVIDGCLAKSLTERVATAGALLAALEKLGEPHRDAVVDVDRSPFNGLSAFQEADSGRFFGRAEDTAATVARVRNHPMVTVIGPSGVGKSSLVRAGVIPALKRSGEGWQSFIVRPGRAPLLALAEIADRLARSVTTETQPELTTWPAPPGQAYGHHRPGPAGDAVLLVGRDAAVERLRAEPGYLGTALRTYAQCKLRRVLLFVDQFEEVYTLCADDRERTAFLACLAGVADDAGSPLRLVLSMRADFLERLAENRSFMSLATRELTLLPPMDRSGLRAALEKPLAAAGYRFESDDTARDMLDGLEGTRGALPLLQFAATKLWKDRDRERRLLTRDSYRAMGGIAGTLAAHADSVVAALTRSQRKLTRAVFERLVTPERTRAVVSVGELCDMSGEGGDALEELLDELARARLLVVDTGTVEIVHESLIEGWPTLRRWLDENHEDAAFLARLRTAAREWEGSGEAEGMLWSGELATEARRWRDGYDGDLSGQEQRFLDAVVALSQRALVLRRRLILAVMAALVLLAIAGGYAVIKGQSEAALEAQRDRVQKQNRTLQALSERLQAQSDELQDKRDGLQRALARAQTAQAAEARAKEQEAQRAQEAMDARAKAEAARIQIAALLAETEQQRQLAVAQADRAARSQMAEERARQKAEQLQRKTKELLLEVERQKRKIEEILERNELDELDL